MQQEIHRITILSREPIQRVPGESKSPVLQALKLEQDTTSIPDITVDGNHHVQQAEKGCSTSGKTPYEPDLLTETRLDKWKANRIGDTDEDVVCIGTSLKDPSRCPTSCLCQCHTKNKVIYRSPEWMDFFLGSYFIGYNNLPMLRQYNCDVPYCNDYYSTIDFHYRFPRWLLNREVSVSAFISSSLVEGASLCLKVPRIIEADDDIWSLIRHGENARFQRLLPEQLYSPVDIDREGDTLLRVCYNA